MNPNKSKLAIDTIDNVHQKYLNERADLAAEITKISEEVTSLQAEAIASASKGDTDGYGVKLSQAEKLKTALDGKRIQLDNMADPVTRDLATAAWDRFVTEYNRQLSANLKRLEEQKRTVFAIYKDLIKAQQEACEIRERLSGYLGLSDSEFDRVFPMDFIPNKMGTDNGILSLNGTTVKDPDCCYYLSSLSLDGLSLAQNKEHQDMARVLMQHKA